jgi:amino acid transporter
MAHLIRCSKESAIRPKGFMNWYQLAAIVIAGPVALITFVQLLVTIFYKDQNTFSLLSAIGMCIGIALLLVAFFGIH